MKALIRTALVAGAALLAACGPEEVQVSDPVGSAPQSPSLEDGVRAATHTCTTFIKGSLEQGASCFDYVDAKNDAITHCATLGLTLGYHSWNISQGTTCEPGDVTYFRYGCCGVE